jgi:hyperosmotically inducible periplasmic protein
MKMILANSVLLVALGSVQAMAQDRATAPDNTGANAASTNSTMTSSVADGQSNLSSDLKITQRIRKSVMADKSLSTYAHNVKIVSVNGAVTLNGVVKDAHEKSVIQAKARAVAGKGNVTNDLSIAPNS